jgi:predicted dehydrogenase
VSLEAALADPAVAAVIVCTPNLLHAETTRAALAAGKHVAVEFPLAASAAKARLLADAPRARACCTRAHRAALPRSCAARARARARPARRGA